MKLDSILLVLACVASGALFIHPIVTLRETWRRARRTAPVPFIDAPITRVPESFLQSLSPPVRLITGWYLAELDAEEALSGLADEVTIGGEAWLRIREPSEGGDLGDAFLVPFRRVRSMVTMTEEEVRALVAGSKGGDAPTMPPITLDPAGADKPN